MQILSWGPERSHHWRAEIAVDVHADPFALPKAEAERISGNKSRGQKDKVRAPGTESGTLSQLKGASYVSGSEGRRLFHSVGDGLALKHPRLLQSTLQTRGGAGGTFPLGF